MKTKMKIAVAVVSIILAVGMSAKAQTPLFTPDLIVDNYTEPEGNDGELFTPNVNLTVTALGYVIPPTSGGSEVGLYDVSTATLLSSVNVNSSNSTAVGSFDYTSIAPVTLTAGSQYELVGLYVPGVSGGGYYTNTPNAGATSDITFNGYAYDYNSTLDMASTAYSPAEFGPNLEYTKDITATPEPSSCALGLVAMAGLGVMAWRRKRMA